MESEDENVQVVFVAPRPPPRRGSSRRKSRKRIKDSAVRVLSIDSFAKNGHRNVFNRQFSMDIEEKRPPVQRLLSIPDVLLNATSEFQSAPRSRVINMFANYQQKRPVYAPSKHPIDLEGLQETAV